MKRYECSKFGNQWGIYDTLEGRWFGFASDWMGADQLAERMNNRQAADDDETLGVEAAWPWMMRKQA